MGFFYDKNAGIDSLKVDAQAFDYIYKVRRTSDDNLLEFRNLKDDNIYVYRTDYLEKKSAMLKLVGSEEKPTKGVGISIGWCVVDPKIIEKTLPMLNELGVTNIDFIYSQYSQRNFSIRTERLESILISSNQQCGRSDMMSFEIFDSLEKWVKAQNGFMVLDFGGEILPKDIAKHKFLIGPEGGFSEEERVALAKQADNIYALDTKLVLKSETAAVMIAGRYV